jgi:hypothetical protein
MVLAELEQAEAELKAAGEERSKEPSKRWQAHYDYVHAQLVARIIYVQEYNLMLGKIRKDELPPLENGQTSYRLSSREKLTSPTKYRDMLKDVKKMLAKVAKDHAGTPWELLAKRAQLTAVGLEWQGTR